MKEAWRVLTVSHTVFVRLKHRIKTTPNYINIIFLSLRKKCDVSEMSFHYFIIRDGRRAAVSETCRRAARKHPSTKVKDPGIDNEIMSKSQT